MHGRRQAKAGPLQHGRPEQRVEVEDVLADEVVQLGRTRRPPPVVERQTVAACEGQARRHVADRRIEPDIEVLARVAGDLEAEVRLIARDVPVAQARVEPLVELVGDTGVERAAAGPRAQHRLEGVEPEEQVLRLALDRTRAADDRHRVDQVQRRISVAADLAGIAVLVLGSAARAGALDVAVGQEHRRLGVVSLADRAPGNIAAGVERPEDALGQLAVLGAVGGVEEIEPDQKVRIGRAMLGGDALDQPLRRHALRLRLQHHRRTVRVVGADVDALVPGEAQCPHPDVGLHGLENVAEVQRAVGVGQSAGDEEATHGAPARLARADDYASRPAAPLTRCSCTARSGSC